MAQQIKSSLTIGLALEQLETMDLPFHLSLTPLVRQSSQDSCLVTLDASGEGPQFWHPTPDRSFQPRVERKCISAANHLHEGLSQRTSYSHLRMSLLPEGEQALVFCSTILPFTQNQPGGSTT